jgi:hypothetical protein
VNLPFKSCTLLILMAGVGVACSAEQGGDGYWSSSIAQGLAAGFVLLFDAVSNFVLHPVATLEGIDLALEHWQVTQGELLSEWGFYRRAFTEDPGTFVGFTLSIGICVLSSALVASFLEGVPGSPSRWRSKRLDTQRIPLQAAFAGGTGIVRRINTLMRATNMQKEKRLASRGRGASAFLRPVCWLILDFFKGLQRLVTEPLPYLGYLLYRLGDRIFALIKTTLKVTWRQLAYLLLPVIIVFQMWIGWSVDFSIASAEARRQLAPVAESSPDAVDSLTFDELKHRAETLQASYTKYREALLVPFRNLDQALDMRLTTLDGQVGAKGIADTAVELRLDVMFERYSRRKLFLAELLFSHPGDDKKALTDPSRNWLETYAAELALLTAINQQVRDSKANLYLAARIDELDRRLAFEYCISRYDKGELLVRPLASEHEYCGSLASPNTVDEMHRLLFMSGDG